MTTKRVVTSLAAITAFALCVLTASLATDASFMGGSVFGVVIVVCLARTIVKRWTSRGGTQQLERWRGRTVVVASQPSISLTDGERENRQRRVIDVELQESSERVVRWLEDAPSYLRIVREILHDYDRLETVAHDAEQESEQLREVACTLIERLESFERDRERLQQEVSRLKTEVERYRQAREEIAVALKELDDGVDRLQGTLQQLHGGTGNKGRAFFPVSANGSAEGGEVTYR